MSFYLSGSRLETIGTQIDYWKAEAAIIDMASDCRTPNSSLKYLYEINVLKPKFFGKVSIRASSVFPSSNEPGEKAGPRFSGIIRESNGKANVEVRVTTHPAVMVFLWLFHIFGLFGTLVSGYAFYAPSPDASWPLVLIFGCFTVIPIFYLVWTRKNLGEEIIGDIRNQLQKKEEKSAELTSRST